MRRAAIVAPVRTPVGKFLGGMRAIPAERLAATAIEAVMARTGVDPARIDEEWQEAPVTFLASSPHEMGGPTGVVARIRAAKRPTARETGR